MLYTLLISTIAAASIKKPKLKKGSSSKKECSSVEEMTWLDFVDKETQNIKNQTETVEKVMLQLCNNKCGQSLLDSEDSFQARTNITSLPKLSAIRAINNIECNYAFMSQASLTVLFVLLV
jgi:hypothetical protein